jgi:predicted nuclease of predicted toxin-antitoxin system
MKLLCDENIDKSIVKSLRDTGFDVTFIREVRRGMKDAEIVEKAYAEKRIIITKDKDFGELVFRLKYRCHGLILLRLNEEDDASYYISRIFEFYKEKINDNFIVITAKTVRIRRLIFDY